VKDEWEGIENGRGWSVNGLFHGLMSKILRDCEMERDEFMELAK